MIELKGSLEDENKWYKVTSDSVEGKTRQVEVAFHNSVHLIILTTIFC